MGETFRALDKDMVNTSSSTSQLSEAMYQFLSTGDTSNLTKQQYE
jgi:hypothetical protein